MLGNKLRSWMDAVRPKKKAHRKDKAQKNSPEPQNKTKILTHDKHQDELLRAIESNGKSTETLVTQPRYSGTNLSSPESAYSTGYSTDGTSPGAPPEYYINIRTGTKYFPNNIPTVPTASCCSEIQQSKNASKESTFCTQTPTSKTAIEHPPQRIATNEVAVMSPRQRNRIRTNPWIGSTGIPNSPRLDASECVVTHPNNSTTNVATKQHLLRTQTSKRNCGQYKGCDTLSSSSCSSLSTTSLHCSFPGRPKPTERNGSLSEDEDDRTLNEMMGKYDESYVYEKETDILSDSDPTDCEIDIDTGQDGGDEDDPLDDELDFIDNDTFLDFGIGELHKQNKGHCTYYSFNAELSRKSCRHPPTSGSRSAQRKNGDRKSKSNKKKHPSKQPSLEKVSSGAHGAMLHRLQIDGSRSAGATPLSIRRTPHPVSKLALEDSLAKLKRRSNSVSLSHSAIDKKDREADKKYKELIIEAEHILMSMKGSSPRRTSGPPNKRVELLRYAETSAPDSFLHKSRLIEDAPSVNLSQTGCSQKKNHLTNFMNSNSSVTVSRLGAPPSAASKLDGVPKAFQSSSIKNSPVLRSKVSKSPKKSKRETCNKTSPKKLRNNSRRKQYDKESSSDSDYSLGPISGDKLSVAFRDPFSCPQSEPVKRKVYMEHAGIERRFDKYFGNKESPLSYADSVIVKPLENSKHPTDSQMSSLRRQVLLNTITNLKRNLEHQSASLQMIYSSAHNLPS